MTQYNFFLDFTATEKVKELEAKLESQSELLQIKDDSISTLENRKLIQC